MSALKYLFRATYTDGTVFCQNPEDVSVVDPQRNAAFDIDHSKLVTFFLSNGSNQLGVDLRDGSFWINDTRFFMHDDEGIGPYRLVRYLTHRHGFNQRYEEQSHWIGYRFGWERDDGKGGVIKRVMQVD